jgi:hypothetical protein
LIGGLVRGPPPALLRGAFYRPRVGGVDVLAGLALASLRDNREEGDPSTKRRRSPTECGAILCAASFTSYAAPSHEVDAASHSLTIGPPTT